MFVLALVLAQVAARATPAPVPTPVALSAPVVAKPTSLSDRAGQIKLNRSGAPTGGNFSVVQSTVPSRNEKPGAPPVGVSKEAQSAQDRMDRAVKDGLWAEENIHYNWKIQNSARAEWDQAAENCRKTQGCKPAFRDDGTGNKPLMTGDEKIDAEARKAGRSRPKLNPN